MWKWSIVDSLNWFALNSVTWVSEPNIVLHLNYLLILISRCNINLTSNINTVEGEQISYKKAFPPRETPLGKNILNALFGFVSFKNNVWFAFFKPFVNFFVNI